MRKFNKFLCTILTFIIMLGCMGNTVFAVSSITELKATVTEPAVGKKPSDVTVDNSRLQVKETNWEGNFNEDGTFKAGEVYTVIYKINFKNYKDVVNYRIKPAANKSTLNGNLAEITFKDGIENATLKYTFPVLTEQGLHVAEKPKLSEEETLDLRKIYSVQEAYNRWAEGNPQHPTELIINDQNISLSGIYPGNGSYEALCLKRVLLDYEVTKFNEADAIAMVYLSNLKEVWLSPKVDVVAFLENLETYPKEAEHPKLKGYMFESGGALTYDFTLYVSDASLPNGYTDGWSRTSSGWDRVGYANLMFKTKLYSGDVYEAFKKGDSAAREIGEMLEYSSADQYPWYQYKDSIRRITIEDSVKSIGSYAFKGFTLIKEITIPSSIRVIGKNPFIDLVGSSTIRTFTSLQSHFARTTFC